jgi:hypothetical protein
MKLFYVENSQLLSRMHQVRSEITELVNQGIIDIDDVRTIMRARVRQVVTKKPNPRYL